jgi:hypothetical protein
MKKIAQIAAILVILFPINAGAQFFPGWENDPNRLPLPPIKPLPAATCQTLEQEWRDLWDEFDRIQEQQRAYCQFVPDCLNDPIYQALEREIERVSQQLQRVQRLLDARCPGWDKPAGK